MRQVRLDGHCRAASSVCNHGPALGACCWPIVAGVLAVVGTGADPVPQVEGRELVEAYASNLAPLQFKALG